MHGGAQIATFRAPLLVFAVLLLALLTGPLLLFTDRLVSTMHRGMLDYGAMARGLGEQLESRWLGRPMEQRALEAPDFSATTDLYAIVSNVYAMNVMPFSLRNLGMIATAMLLPFLPVVLLAMSPLALHKRLGGFIL